MAVISIYNMTIFITEVIIIALLLILLVNCLYKKSTAYSNENIDIKSYNDGIPNNLDYVFLGSTYAKFAFGAYKDFNLNASDLTLQAESLDADEAILKQYYKNLNDGAYVFITLAACCMLYEGYDNIQYYRILEDKNNPKFHLSTKLKSVFPLLLNPKKIKQFLRDHTRYESVYDTIYPWLSADESKKVISGYADGWCKLFNLNTLSAVELKLSNISVIERNQDIICNMLKLCVNRGLRPVIIIPPFSDHLNKYFSDDFVKKALDDPIRSVVDKADKEFGIQVKYLNYRTSDEFKNGYELYCDGGFRLNRIGSRKFISRLIRDLDDRRG